MRWNRAVTNHEDNQEASFPHKVCHEAELQVSFLNLLAPGPAGVFEGEKVGAFTEEGAGWNWIELS